MVDSAIEITNLNKWYGDLHALKDVSMTIKKGEFFGLLGPNGAGKTTLIGILANLIHKDRGHVTILGDDISEYPLRVKKKIGIVPQEVALDPFFSVRDTLRIQSGYFGISHNGEKIEEILSALGLKDKEHVNPRKLSGGMKRRLLIAKALVHDPEIIVLDEPTAGVDIELRNSLWDYVRRLNRSGKTIILTTHYLEEAEQLCDRIAILNLGKVAALDSKQNLMNLVDRKILKLTYTGRVEEITGSGWRLKRAYEIQGEQVAEFELQKKEMDCFINTLKRKNITILDIDIESAKLEEVFLQLVTLKETAK